MGKIKEIMMDCNEIGLDAIKENIFTFSTLESDIFESDSIEIYNDYQFNSDMFECVEKAILGYFKDVLNIDCTTKENKVFVMSFVYSVFEDCECQILDIINDYQIEIREDVAFWSLED